jgi:cell division protein FtsQ
MFFLMARNQGPPSDDPFYRRGEASRRSFADDALTPDPRLDEDEDEEDQQQFRRASKRVSVRRGALPRKTASRVRNVLAVLLALAALGAAVYEVRSFALHSWRFRVRNDSIELTGDAPASRAQVMDKLRESVGKNVFQISLEERKRELEKIPWVETASIIRIWPNHLRVMVKERTPVAFIALGERIGLVDAYGVVMDLPQGRDYSFPVILGMSENEPLSTRAPRMKTFTRLMRELDEGGSSAAAKPQYSRNLDEVDLSDPEDVKVLTKGGSGPILLHLGNENFLQRFMTFLSNVQKWEQERGKLKSVDLRYGHEVILNPDMQSAPPPPTPVAKAAPPEPAKAGKTGHEPQKKRK